MGDQVRRPLTEGVGERPTTAKPRPSAGTVECCWCGEQHSSKKCPFVKALEFWETGPVRRVEFFTSAEIHSALLEQLKRG